jgi:hypothetical protein
MAEVTKYHVLVYGGPNGYQTNRSQIALYGSTNAVIAYLRFNDPGMAFENDDNTGGVIKMHLPSTMFDSVLDLLRNEKPIQVYFAQGRGFFGTGSTEPVGEGEA